MGGIASKPIIQFPAKFAIPKTDKFTNSKQHLLQYLSFVKMKGLNEQQVLHAFPLSLSRIAVEWYYTMDVEKTKALRELIDLFVKQFSYNTMVDVMLKDLETMRHNDNEPFSEFITRWREKVVETVNLPAEKD